jgi:predicted nucleotidyltransferase
MSESAETLVNACRKHYPLLQAVYLFGSRGAGTALPDSDYDVALLLPPKLSREAGALALSPLHQELERVLGAAVDLVNLRLASTVMAKEVIANGVRVACPDISAADEFEALTLSFYQELNRERAAILLDFERTGRAYAV